ncbi:26S proteasome regulatory subunit N6 [Pancytospora epiphaga]|nr:26S proteasome regulatory subunit N6 [Pancytospora epiphaga]
MLREELERIEKNEDKEQHVLAVSRKMIESNNYDGLLKMMGSLQDLWKDLSTVRLTKIIKRTLDMVPLSAESYTGVLTFLSGLIEAYNDKKMLCLDLRSKEVHVLLSVGKYTECLTKITSIAKDLKQFDDKINLISLYVYESRAHYELRDFSKARASLTSARALVVSAPCPAQLQAQIDLLNGMYLSDEKSYAMAISYFIEAIEGFVQDKLLDNARIALRYIMLCKIMSEQFNEVPAILEAKYAKSINGDCFIEVLLKIAAACKKRDLKAYADTLSEHGGVLEVDSYLYRHLQQLYAVLLDNNILKIIEPYSHVRIDFIAQKLNAETPVIEAKLRKMILDKTISGILDHVTQCLIISPEKSCKETGLSDAIAIMEKFFAS